MAGRLKRKGLGASEENPLAKSRKRLRPDEAFQVDPPDEPLTKKRIGQSVDHHDSWRYPPEFWDRLSQIPFIRSALEELDRRTKTRPSVRLPRPPLIQACDLAPPTARELARFARHGGPDLRDLRGYPAAPDHRLAGAMSSSRSRVTKSTDPTTLPTTTGTPKTKKSSPYNRGFEQHLTDNAVHPTYKSRKPENFGDIKAALAVPRPSLSPSKFSEGAFEAFQESNAQAKDEDDVRLHVLPTIIGARQSDHPSATNTAFLNLEPLTDGTLVSAKPDTYYGAPPEQLHRPIRDELGRYIIPSTMEDKPMAPNLFMEAKGPDGSAAVALRQARYDGAYGARGMHSLQNYGADEPVYDNNAYTYSSTYLDGYLKMYTHHPTAPTTPGGQPEYHMTQANAYAMTGSRAGFVEGATAFRNARDLARKHRNSFIATANARYQISTQAPPSQGNLTGTTEVQEEDASSHGDFVDCEDYPAAHEDDFSQQDESQAPADFEVDFASSFNTHGYQSRSKRAGDSHSPPSNSHRSKKPRQPILSVLAQLTKKGTVTFIHPDTGKEVASARDSWAAEDGGFAFQSKTYNCVFFTQNIRQYSKK